MQSFRKKVMSFIAKIPFAFSTFATNQNHYSINSYLTLQVRHFTQLIELGLTDAMQFEKTFLSSECA